MADELVAFLRARYDEEAQMARAATPGPWSTMGQRVLDPSPPSDLLGVGMAVGHAAASADYNETAAHIARHDPARVLREVEAHRLLLDDIVSDWEQAAPGKIDQHLRQHRGSSALIDPETGEEEMIREWTVTRQLRLLALPYADHSDYREEWRP